MGASFSTHRDEARCRAVCRAQPQDRGPLEAREQMLLPTVLEGSEPEQTAGRRRPGGKPATLHRNRVCANRAIEPLLLRDGYRVAGLLSANRYPGKRLSIEARPYRRSERVP